MGKNELNNLVEKSGFQSFSPSYNILQFDLISKLLEQASALDRLINRALFVQIPW